MAQVQLEELIYAESLDNSAGPQYDLPLLSVDIGPATWVGTMGDGSVTPLSKYFAAQLQRAAALVNPSDALPLFKALVSIQTLKNGQPTPAVGGSSVGSVVTFYATIPAAYIGSFVWGMTPDSTGGWALPGGGAAGGGGGGGGAPSGPAGGVLDYVEIDGVTNPSTYPNPNGLAVVVDDGGGVWRIPVRNNDPGKTTLAIGPDANNPFSGGTETWSFRGPDGAATNDPLINADDGVKAEIRSGRGGDSLPNDVTATANGGAGAELYVWAGDGGQGGGGGGAAGGGGGVTVRAGYGGPGGAGVAGGPPGDGGDAGITAGYGGTGSATHPAGKGGRLLLYAGDAGSDVGGGVGAGGNVIIKGGNRSDNGAAGNNGRILHDSVSSFAALQSVNITAVTTQFGFVNSPVIAIDSDAAYVMAPAGKLIEDGSEDGDTVTIQNVGIFAITLQGEATSAGSNLLIGGGSSRQLSPNGGNITLRWSDNFTKWIEIAFAGSVT
jgi:hypothetical protein